MLEIAISNSDRLVRLVNDILDLERIGSGKAERMDFEESCKLAYKRGSYGYAFFDD